MKKLIWIVSILLTGCNGFLGHDDSFFPGLPANIPPPPKRNGTIYQPGYEMTLYQDKIARRVGDVLTIRLEETTKGEYKSKTKTDKKAQLNYPTPIFYGQVLPELQVQTNTQQTFDGSGNSDQSNKLMGTMSVTVIDVMANGNLVVQGESWVNINQGREYLRLRGIVRQIDISPDNIVSSQRIADAQINYGAQGQAGYASSGGLITKLFNRFYPY
ncbi:hypothetical protein EP47_04860 [Legionella norrlandica]|uniref:Flagellar L-ring protein n=1 Tax=Legionella norrlandica TaxID=1498499 RepID=A0A0A2SVD4_9GAMM|nr:flagellar basal body L-ring protein FlgH [Legionella norrlandica]KGP63696.1 hypothetical protein EP47_04860 [Legionella norrlandica]